LPLLSCVATFNRSVEQFDGTANTPHVNSTFDKRAEA
jgi:hypothetical protein